MGKRITQQARGKGSFTFRVRRKGYMHRITYPLLNVEGVGKIIKLFNSAGHSSPLAMIKINIENTKQDKEGSSSSKTSQSLSNLGINNKVRNSQTKSAMEQKNNRIKFIVPAADGVYEGKEIYICKFREGGVYEAGDIVKLKDVKQGERVFNIENTPGKGGKILRSGGSSGVIGIRDEKGVEIIIKRRKIKLNENCRAVAGVASGEGRKMKPFIKAGRKHHLMKSKGRKWHRTSAVKVNAIDHPFGGGRGKRIKSKIAKRNSPPGLKVGHIRPRKTGRRK